MLDSKDLKILSFIDKNREWDSIVSLCEKLGFSRGDFYYHINHINKFLKENGHPEMEFSSKSKNVIDYKVLKDTWSDFFKSSNSYSLTARERMWFLMILIAIEGRVTLKEISSFFNMSVNNAYIDVKNCVHEVIFAYHNHYEISIANLGKGYSLVGDEGEVFRLLYYACTKLSRSDNSKIIINILLNNLSKFDSNYPNIQNIEIYRVVDTILKRKFMDSSISDKELSGIALFMTILISNKFKKKDIKLNITKSNDFLSMFKTLYCHKLAQKTVSEIKTILKIKIVNEEILTIILASLLFCENTELLFQENENKLTKMWDEIKTHLKTYGYELDSLIKGYDFFDYLLGLKYNLINDFDFQHESKFNDEKDYVIFMDFFYRHEELLAIFQKFVKRDLSDCERENLIYLIYKNILNIYAEQIIGSDNIIIVTDIEDGYIEAYVDQILKIYKTAKIRSVLSLEDYIKNIKSFKNHLVISDYREKEIPGSFIHIPFQNKQHRTAKLIIKKEVSSIIENDELTNDEKICLITNLLLKL